MSIPHHLEGEEGEGDNLQMIRAGLQPRPFFSLSSDIVKMTEPANEADRADEVRLGLMTLGSRPVAAMKFGLMEFGSRPVAEMKFESW